MGGAPAALTWVVSVASFLSQLWQSRGPAQSHTVRMWTYICKYSGMDNSDLTRTLARNRVWSWKEQWYKLLGGRVRPLSLY